MPLPKEQKGYTYQDYLSWPEDERYELIDGVVYAQATPSPIHQKIIGNLYAHLHAFFKDKDCIPFLAPFTVRLPLEATETDKLKNKNIVEPDISIICDKNKLDKNGYDGAPTLIIEIVSKSSIKKDNVLKLNKYQKSGVVEYWIITPENELIMRYSLNDKGSYGLPEAFVLDDDEEIQSKVFPELKIALQDVFFTW